MVEPHLVPKFPSNFPLHRCETNRPTRDPGVGEVWQEWTGVSASSYSLETTTSGKDFHGNTIITRIKSLRVVNTNGDYLQKHNIFLLFK